MMSLTFGLFTQVSGSGPLGPLVLSEFADSVERQFSAIFTCKTYNVSFSLRNATWVSSDVIFLPNALLYVVNLPRGVRTPKLHITGSWV